MITDPVHYSNLSRMALSPAHYLYAVTVGVTDTRAMRIGSVAHHMVLGGRHFHAYDGERRGNAWKEFKAEHDDGLTIATTKEVNEAMWIAAAVSADPVAQELLGRAPVREQEILWKYLGRSCSSRPDAVGPNVLIELKTSNTSSPDRLPWHAMKMGWHAQLAFYAQALGRDPMTAAAFMIVVEAAMPHPVTCFQLTPRVLDYGQRQCRLWMEKLLVCEATNQWPGYAQSVVTLDAPDTDELVLNVEGEDLAI